MRKRVVRATMIVVFLLYSICCCKAASKHLEFDQMLGIVAFSQSDRLLCEASFDVTTSNGMVTASFEEVTSAEMGFLMTVPVWNDYRIESETGTCSVEYSMPVITIDEICEKPAAVLVDKCRKINVPRGKRLLIRSLEINDADIYINGSKLAPGEGLAPIYDTAQFDSKRPTWLQMYYE